MWRLWDKLTKAVHLPLPEGPYIPGGVDIMTEHSANGTFIRVYYPSHFIGKKEKTAHSLDAFQKQWISWLPEHKYFDGCAKLIGLWKILIWGAYAIIAGLYAKIPVAWGSQFSPLKADNLKSEVVNSSKTKKHPLVIISHGMAGNRFAHSALGLEMASNGFVVATVEHKDGSASGTFHFKSMDHRNRGEKTWLPYRNVKFGKAEHHEVRKEQVELRAQELARTLDVFEKINSGELSDSDNILHTDYAGLEFKVSQMKGRIDLTSPALIGFSFGGPSALLAIKKDPRFRRGIGLDVWMFPIKKEIEEVGNALLLPLGSSEPNCKLLFINSETFHNAVNLTAMRALIDVMKKPGIQSKVPRVTTVLGTTHEHLCDWSLLLGSWLDFFHLGKLSPVHAHQLISKLVLQFLSEPYAKIENSGLYEELKDDCDEGIQTQLHHLVFDLKEVYPKK